MASGEAWTQPTTLERAGRASWLAVGIVLIVLIAASVISALSGILVPLVLAAIIGTVLRPLVGALERLGVPGVLATIAGMLLTVAIAAGTVWIVVSGFLSQLPEISQQLMLGWTSFTEWLRSFDFDTVLLERLRETAYGYAPAVGQGILGVITSTFAGAISLFIGVFFSLFLLFFVLRDGHRFPGWLSSTTGQDPELVDEIDGLVQRSLLGYFRGTAVTALITAPVFVIPLLLLQVPLVVPIFVLYFFLSFVPYVGAWLTGVFAVLIAFGSGGAPAALIIALSLLVSNGTIQSAVSSWALGSSLKLHPVAVLLATITGGTVAGLLGMVLGPPLLAAVTTSVRAVRRRREEREIVGAAQGPGSSPKTASASST